MALPESNFKYVPIHSPINRLIIASLCLILRVQYDNIYNTSQKAFNFYFVLFLTQMALSRTLTVPPPRPVPLNSIKLHQIKHNNNIMCLFLFIKIFAVFPGKLVKMLNKKWIHLVIWIHTNSLWVISCAIPHPLNKFRGRPLSKLVHKHILYPVIVIIVIIVCLYTVCPFFFRSHL